MTVQRIVIALAAALGFFAPASAGILTLMGAGPGTPGSVVAVPCGSGWTGPTSGLTHCWPLDDVNISGSTVIDVIGSVNGTITGGVTSTSSPSGATAATARAFDGTGYITLSGATLPTFSGAHSVFFWSKLTNIATGGSGGSSQTFFMLTNDASNLIRGANEESAPAGAFVVALVKATVNIGQQTSAAASANNTWVCLGYTYNGVIISAIYVNGTAVSIGAQAGFGTTNNNLIGGRSATLGLETGALYTVATWNRELSAGEGAQFCTAK